MEQVGFQKKNYKIFKLILFYIIFRYEYEIEVKISSQNTGILSPRHESKIILKADHIFGNFTSRINSSDKVWFKGILRTTTKSDDLLTCKNSDLKLTRIELNSIGCLHCSDKSLSPITITSKWNIENHIKDLQRGIKYLLNVLFNPLVTFK